MKRNLFVLIVALLALMLAGSVAAESNSPPAASAYTGTLTVIVGDPMPTAGEPMTPIPPIFTLHLSDGRELRLLPGAAGENELLRLAGQRVSVTLPAAEAEAALAVDDLSTPGVPVASAALAPGAVMLPPEVSGNTRWVTIACKFADVADEPRTVAYYREMYRNTYPGLDHYWREASYGQVNLTGSTAIGWYTLPKPHAAYFDVNGTAILNVLANDCLDQADPDLFVPDYAGINLVFNDDLGCCAYGIWSYPLIRDNVTQFYGMTWLPRGATTLSLVQHEMGHGYGMLHSASSQGYTYFDLWDVMGQYLSYCHIATDPIYGCIGIHPIAYQRDAMGWLAPERVYVAGPGVHTVTLERTVLPTTGDYLMVRVPINSSMTHYYTVEVRRRLSYDSPLPTDTVIIHDVDTMRYPDHAWLVATGSGSNGQDASAWWMPGEAFATINGNIIIRVEQAIATGAVVTIVNGAEPRQLLLAPTDDAYVLESTPTSVYGGAAALTLQNPPRSQVYLKFDAASMPAAAYRIRLRLTVTTESGEARLGKLYEASPYFGSGATPWTETSLSWANRPAEAASASLATWVNEPTRDGAQVEWDVTNAFAHLGVIDVFGLFPGRGVDSRVNYGSKESTASPYLVFDYLVAPDESESYTFLPTNDATVSQAKPKLISGTKPTLQVKDAAKDFNAYVKFNVTGMTGAVQSATLRLWVRDGGPDGGRVYSTSPFYPNTTTQWLETGLKWSNAPAIGGTALDAAGAVTAGQWIEMDVTAAITGDGRASFALTNDSANLVTYSSKEGAHAPELVIVTD